ncbi:hypothetical protein FRC00_008323 [Tulasnella sp. 408]|nr:hypothetical protein FRC00_008323 [Tulasnella sp. 408]
MTLATLRHIPVLPRERHDLSYTQMPLFNSSHPINTGQDLSMQAEDILIQIFSLLDLADLHSMRLVSRRLRSLVNSRIVWLDLLKRLELPLPPLSCPTTQLPQRDLERLAVRAVRLETNWRSPQPKPYSARTVPVDSVIVAMSMCRGTLFTAHKDGMLRCWHDLDSPLSPNESRPGGGREDPRRFTVLAPENRIVKFTQMQVTADMSRRRFVVMYVGDGVDRSTHSGVFTVAMDQRPDGTYEAEAKHSDASKGIVTVAVSATSMIVARSAGSLSVIDWKTEASYNIDAEAARGASGNGKVLRLCPLEDDKLLLLTTDAVAVYRMPTAQEPLVDIPEFIRPLPRCVAGWFHQGPDTASPSTSTLPTMLTVLTEESETLRYSILVSDQGTDDGAIWDLVEVGRESFPYPVERLSMTEMYGGRRRSVWVHWRRGFEDWPLHILGTHYEPTGANQEPIISEETGVGSIPDRGGLGTTNDGGAAGFGFAPLATVGSAAAPSSNSQASLSQVVWNCTRAVAMPRVTFDEATGRMCVAGLSSQAITICEYA